VAPEPEVQIAIHGGAEKRDSSSALVLSRATAEMLGGILGVETEPGVGTMLFFDMPAFASEEALLTAVFGGRATGSQRRLLGIPGDGPVQAAGAQPPLATQQSRRQQSSRHVARPLAPQEQAQVQRAQAQPQQEPAQPEQAQPEQARTPARAQMPAQAQPTTPEHAQAQAQTPNSRAASVVSGRSASEPKPAVALGLSPEENDALLKNYAAVMGDRILTRSVSQHTLASEVSDSQRVILTTKVLAHTNIR
jgi:hypothetical protein